MDLRFVGFSLGLILSAISLFMLVPALLDFHDGNIHNAQAFLMCSLGGFFTGSLLSLTNSHYRKILGVRESFLMTTICWVSACLLASLPLYFSDLNLHFIDALFEGTSGITTTGGTVLSGLDQMSRGILLWRSLTHFIGGMGVIGLSIIFLPFLRIGGMQLFRMESSEKSEKIVPRTAHLILGLFVTYTVLIIMATYVFVLLGMGWFDAINYGISAVSTGGLATHDSSMASFSPALQWACILFMLAGGIPMILFFRLFYKGDTRVFSNSQVQTFIAIVVLSSVAMGIWRAASSGDVFIDAVRHTTFNIVSVITTTGFASTDYMSWGSFSMVVFLFLSYLGGCTGSTSGGIKIMRLQIAAKQGLIQIRRLVYPNGVFPLTYEGKTVTPEDLKSIMVFLSLYVVANAATALILTCDGLDFPTALSAAASAIGNVGVGVGSIIGPAGNFSSLSVLSKFLLSIGMILGRLEIMTILVLLHPAFWRR